MSKYILFIFIIFIGNTYIGNTYIGNIYIQEKEIYKCKNVGSLANKNSAVVINKEDFEEIKKCFDEDKYDCVILREKDEGSVVVYGTKFVKR